MQEVNFESFMNWLKYLRDSNTNVSIRFEGRKGTTNTFRDTYRISRSWEVVDGEEVDLDVETILIPFRQWEVED